MSRVYKILDRPSWDAALARGVFEGSPVDEADGYIHLSTADQAQETARRYFRDQPDLVLLAVDAAALGDALKWEPSRGGALFPHLHGPLATRLVVEVADLTLDADGVPLLGALKA